MAGRNNGSTQPKGHGTAHKGQGVRTQAAKPPKSAATSAGSKGRK
ncbi:hypothetical protein [Streptomyces sp.]